MAINYAPILDGSLPGFYHRTLVLPFTMNQAVSENEVFGFALKLKTISTNTEKFTLKIIFDDDNGYKKEELWDQENSTITFTNFPIKKNSDRVKGLNNTFYKIQLAYIDKDGLYSPYSTVGIIKYSAKPSVNIKILNKNPLSIKGVYSCNDTSEKLYSSYFTIIEIDDNNETVVMTTEEKIHNTFYDSDDTAIEYLNTQYQFKSNFSYRIEFYTTSINGIKNMNATKAFSIGTLTTINKIVLTPKLNYEEGYIDLQFTSKPGWSGGTFIIARSSSVDNFTFWDPLTKYKRKNLPSNHSIYRDYAIEQGVAYKYCLYGLDETESSYITQNISESIIADFEDMFLSDSKHSLRIRFNPKVSSLKNTILESKLDTIGSKYPFFFRNGYVNYKELPISGLISYFMDEENLFSNKSFFSIDSDTNNYKTTQLTSSNIYNERQFKMEVLDWLTNGQPKLFKSPAEGTYIVRLINVSLSPVSDGLSRMLHTFSGTAYQIDDLNMDNLTKYNLISQEGIK